MANPLPLRITVVRPPHGVLFRLQRGRTDLVAPVHTSDDAISFDFTLRLGPRRGNGGPNFLGEFAQGTPANRFIYVNSGTSAGQADSCWDRRAKVALAGITWALVEAVERAPGAVLEARIQGTGRDGGPACASVPLLETGWRITTGAP
jgi:hypothetical protein